MHADGVGVFDLGIDGKGVLGSDALFGSIAMQLLALNDAMSVLHCRIWLGSVIHPTDCDQQLLVSTGCHVCCCWPHLLLAHTRQGSNVCCCSDILVALTSISCLVEPMGLITCTAERPHSSCCIQLLRLTEHTINILLS